MNNRHLNVGLALAAITFLALPASAQTAPKEPVKDAAPKAAQPAATPAELTPLAHVEKRGTGPISMILVPGLLCDWTVYETFMTRNAAKYTMYAVTLPGFGGSKPPAIDAATPPSKSVWLENAQAAILQLVDAKKLDKPVLVGHSLGGHLAARIAASNGSKFRSVVSLDGYPAFPLAMGVEISPEQRKERIDGGFKAQFDTLTEEEWATQMKGGMASMVTSPDRAKQIGDMASKVSKAIGGRYMLELLASDASPGMASVTVPYLFIGAIGDGPAEAQADVLANTIQKQTSGCKAATVVFFHNTRHFIMDDAPAELDKAIESFVAGKPVEGKSTPKDLPPPVKALPVDEAPKKK